jgi:hypothetical protein
LRNILLDEFCAYVLFKGEAAGRIKINPGCYLDPALLKPIGQPCHPAKQVNRYNPLFFRCFSRTPRHAAQLTAGPSGNRSQNAAAALLGLWVREDYITYLVL